MDDHEGKLRVLKEYMEKENLRISCQNEVEGKRDKIEHEVNIFKNEKERRAKLIEQDLLEKEMRNLLETEKWRKAKEYKSRTLGEYVTDKKALQLSEIEKMEKKKREKLQIIEGYFQEEAKKEEYLARLKEEKMRAIESYYKDSRQYL